MIATVDPSRSAPAGRASRIACGGAGSDDDAVCLPPDALHHQALGQQPAARHERGHENDPPADQREPPGVIESAPEPCSPRPGSCGHTGSPSNGWLYWLSWKTGTTTRATRADLARH